MSRQVLGPASYRFRATFGRGWGGYLTVVILVGLAGGLAMAAVAAARRTQSSLPTYLASTNPSELTFLTGMSDPGPGRGGYDPALLRKIAQLPHVKRVESYAGLDAAVLSPSGAIAANAQGVRGSIDSEYFDQDRVTIVDGRMADPRRPDEAVVDAKGTGKQPRVGGGIGPAGARS